MLPAKCLVGDMEPGKQGGNLRKTRATQEELRHHKPSIRHQTVVWDELQPTYLALHLKLGGRNQWYGII